MIDKTDNVKSEKSRFYINLGDAPKNILIVDRSPVFAKALSKELGMQEAFECDFISRGANIADEVLSHKPDAVIIDPAEMSVFGITDLKELGLDLRRIHPPTRVLGYTFKVSNSMVSATLDAGFGGCISRDVGLNQLLLALAAILEGGIYFDQTSGAHLRPMIADTYDTDGLSEREKEVLIGSARGLSSKQIAHALNISNKTVDTYKARACQKLNLQDREKLVKYVLDKGWIS